MDEPGEGESENRYRQLIETSPAPINLFDASGDIIWGNDAVLDLLGLPSRDQLIGRSIFEFIDTDDHETAKRELAEVVENKIATGPTEMQLRPPDGETRTIRVSTAPGTYRGTDIGQAVIIDVTQLKSVQAALEAEREFIEDAINTLQDAFYVLDSAGDLVRWNETLLERSGYTDSEVRDMALEDFFVQADVDRVSESIATAFAAGTDTLEATVVTKRGTTIPYEFRKRRLSRDGDVIGVVGIGRDVSDRNARDQHLHAVDRLLQHHLRNQVTVIRGQAEILRRDGVESDAHLDRIESASERLLSLFDDHHHIVNVLTERDQLEAVDVVSVLDSVLRDVERAFPAATISRNLPAEATALALSTLQNAIRELVENAIEHSESTEPTVEVAVDTDEASVEIHVLDTGPRIPQNERAALETDSAFGPTSHSTGLGLWLVHWIVKRSGGTLRFGENDPRGNVVTMEFQTPGDRLPE
ncbi:PAS domain S-box protein [Haloarcula salina]|uniref:histidine kinase n=1 Tax=Haloarcula salina TaxID=1429914 RepID=A0AA41G1G7_9EURY|nr:PAS domain S-box protein [Haloarcula salina]MBV0902660.1 PAS domain S-box protein [Haloarcula salina]